MPKNKELFKNCTHKWCASMFSRLQSIWKQTVSNLLNLYGQYSKKPAGKKWLQFDLIVTLNRYPVVTQCILWTDPKYSVHQEPSRKKVASIWAYVCSILRVHSNHSLCLSIPKLTNLICSIHQDPSHQNAAFIWAYMCSILRVHCNHSLCPSIRKFTDPICSVHKKP